MIWDVRAGKPDQTHHDMKIIVTYRRTSRLGMRIGKNGNLLVSAPLGMPRTTIEAFIRDNKDWISGAEARAKARRESEENFFGRLPLDSRKEMSEAARRLSRIVEPLLEKYAALMGVNPSSVTYTMARTRWGSCNCTTGSINFSVYLLLLPPLCIEATVVHELAHLIVPNHGPRFYAVMDKYFPEWREAKRLSVREMNSNGGKVLNLQ